MSHFWDALKEANRNQSNEAVDGSWEGLPVPAVEPRAHAGQTAGVISPPVAAPLSDTKAEAPELTVKTAPAAFPSPEPLAAPPEAPRFAGRSSVAVEEMLPFVPPVSEERAPRPVRAAPDRNLRLIPRALDPAVVEHYRRLRTKIAQQQETKSFRSLLITSPGPQDGKSVTVMNLGLSFASLPSFDVLVVDGDLRRGTLGKWLGVDHTPGLSNLIEGSAGLDDVLFRCEESGVYYITRGNSRIPAGELLNSDRLGPCMQRLTERFPLVLVDSPPINLIADVHLLAAACDAVLLVVRAFTTSRKTLEKATNDLLPFRLIGSVLNAGAPAKLHHRYKGYYGKPE